MPTTNNIMTGAKLIKLVDDLLYELESLKLRPETPPDIVQQYKEDVDRLGALLEKLVREGIHDNTEKFKAVTGSLTKINKELLTTLHDLTKIADTLKNLSRFIELLGEIAGIAFSVVKTTGVHSVVGVMKKESSAEEKTAIVPLEEVLYRVELTPTKLIVTVDAELNRPVEVIFRKG
jgi:hypothetical protein